MQCSWFCSYFPKTHFCFPAELQKYIFDIILKKKHNISFNEHETGQSFSRQHTNYVSDLKTRRLWQYSDERMFPSDLAALSCKISLSDFKVHRPSKNSDRCSWRMPNTTNFPVGYDMFTIKFRRMCMLSSLILQHIIVALHFRVGCS